MMVVFLRIFCLIGLCIMSYERIAAQSNDSTTWIVSFTNDFEIDGKGSADEWNNAWWLELPCRTGNSSLKTRVKTLYSKTGMYFFFECEDKKITSTMKADLMDLWNEDVFEVFIQTDEKKPAYFEYELSPNNYELPLLISNVDFNLTRWVPFHYEADRKTRHSTNINLNKEINRVGSWTGEFFIPYALLRPLESYIPKSGTKWRGNFYRNDYDDNNKISWTWQKTEKSFHDMKHFGTFIFE